jgi:hypothetical protein
MTLETRLISRKDNRYLVSLCGPWEQAKDLPKIIGVVYDADDDQWLPPTNLDRILSRSPWQRASASDEEEFEVLIARHPIPSATLQQGSQLLASLQVPAPLAL